ncbi:hypothetical protein CKM354_000436100 [Cercospora kikuchii]|uniref:Uncharacterized protein n=1 Tax=Cercospora kikuchii TaxID=84275 RepID=A0A9P3CDQ4_9PEZI|nr:uncharacterized protein CKM354_000436100 [Cercospora kikuchii]GIZ41044.1 hypothetical protein CKM354_000436100 [Cercospora kikuchii]
MVTCDITGASRGTELELVKQLTAVSGTPASKIFAITRGSSSLPEEIISSSPTRVVNIACKDPCSEEVVLRDVNEALKHADPIDVLSGAWRSFSTASKTDSISSIKRLRAMSGHSYKISKALMTTLTAFYAVERNDFVVVAISPRWLRTDSAGPDADLPVEFGVSVFWKRHSRGKEI